ncbi:hypothetical protein H5410_020378 [Solanum commersonii]|uniref:BURP domain-containing protein n=1 Tax=Solanum commersonii TaxID=4109 RepID=A0A9J5Z897_SOLCO|nr:hypothetical protein H5410_020378 [Solanum commersonii]
MDVKLGFCVLVSLILLVAYGTEARKIVEGNSDDNHEQALKKIYGNAGFRARNHWRKTQIKALTTITTHDISPLLRRYTILDTPQQITTPKMVACHLLSSPDAVFYCHHTIDNKIKVFKVSLGRINEANGDRLVEAMVVCHLDTSEWNPSHESFRSLGVLPGTSPICHFFTSSNDLVWIPKSVATTPLVAAL